MRSRVRVWAAGAAVLGVLAVSACDPGDDPTDPPTTSAESTTSDEPTTSESPSDEVSTPPEVEAPTPPEGMNVDDHQGAALAVQYFFDLYSYMRTTWDTSEWDAMSDPDCGFCTDHSDYVGALEDAGAWIEGGEIIFDLADADVVLPTEDQPAYTVVVDAVEQPLIAHNADGTSTREPDERDVHLEVGVSFVGDRFIVLGVNLDTA